MDFPVFHLDWLGNRGLIAIVAVLHVFINHALAVGAAPLITAMEWWGLRTGDQRWDRLAYKLLGVCFIITTSVGALTGVGIWFTTSLVNPAAIGSLIRVFFWAWFTEWIVFVTEVGLMLVYFLTWKRMTGARKRRHIGIGVALSIASWGTMAIIVAILGFMMDTGSWPAQPSFWRGVLNPIYLPQLLFRTPYAMMAAGLFAMLGALLLTQRGSEFRAKAVRFVSVWTLMWTPLCLAGAVTYRLVIPKQMAAEFPVALATLAFQQWYHTLLWVIAGAIGVMLLATLLGAVRPARFPRVALVLPFMLCLLLLGSFERVREFVRKPFVIENYMYANGIRKDAYPLLAKEGLLSLATYTPVRTVNDADALVAGKEVFRLACTRCHTTHGVNSVVAKLTGLFGKPPWVREDVDRYLANMQNARPFMPPLPGTDAERAALVEYLLSLPNTDGELPGAQSVGVQVPPAGAG